jgi:hypothetical protein
VWKPKHRLLRKALFANKYKVTVYKVQLGISFLGHILVCTGPHLPRFDGHIWEQTMSEHPLEPWEWWLGGTDPPSPKLMAPLPISLCSDGHYIACKNILTPWRKDRKLSDDEAYANTIISFYRARVEHINGAFVRHNLFRGVYRGGIHILHDVVQVTAHMTAASIRQAPRYTPVGPWPHYTGNTQ